MTRDTLERTSAQSSATALEAARAEWLRLLGAEHVIAEDETLRAAESSTFATHQRVPANDGGIALGQAVIAGLAAQRG